MAHAPVITQAQKKVWKNQREWLVETIRGAGDRGITNTALNTQRLETFESLKGAQGLHGRISELRDELFEEGIAVLSIPLDDGEWLYKLGDITPEYRADHIKRRKPKMRSDRFPKAIKLNERLLREAATGTVTKETLLAIQEFTLQAKALELHI